MKPTQGKTKKLSFLTSSRIDIKCVTINCQGKFSSQYRIHIANIVFGNISSSAILKGGPKIKPPLKPTLKVTPPKTFPYK